MSEKRDIDNDRVFISRCFDLDNLSFLVGTGLSKAFDGPTMTDIAKDVFNNLKEKKDSLDKAIYKWAESDLNGDSPNIENFLDKLYLKKKYVEEIGEEDKANNELIEIVKNTLFRLCLFTPNKDKLPLMFKFLISVINRKSGLSRVGIFTLNYDLLIEQCADKMGILLNDGFDGSVKRWLNTAQFDLDFYYPSGVVGDKPVRCERIINYFKLHGSLNWVKEDDRIIKGPCSGENMLVYPCLAKYDSMLCEPFSEMFRRFSISIKRPKGALIVIGYSFSDLHINQILTQALEQPSFRLIIINPNKERVLNNFPQSKRFTDHIKLLNVTVEEFIEKYLPKDFEQFITPTDEVLRFFKKMVEATKVDKNEAKS